MRLLVPSGTDPIRAAVAKAQAGGGEGDEEEKDQEVKK